MMTTPNNGQQLQSNIEGLKEYLKKAKANNWCLDQVGLANQYGVSTQRVRDLVDEIYNTPWKR